MKLIKLILPLFTLLIIFSCKKGAEDPVISFFSRKARFVGEWKVASYKTETVKIVTTFTGTFPSSSTTNLSYINDGSTTIETITHPGSGTNSENIYDETITYSIKPNGTWKSENTIFKTEKKTIYEGYPPNETSYVRKTETNQKIENSGNWNFVARVGEAKNKETVVLSKTASVETKDISITDPKNSTSSTVVITNAYNDFHTYWKLIKLANKEIKLVVNYYYAQDASTNGNSNGINSEKTTTEMTLQQVKKK